MQRVAMAKLKGFPPIMCLALMVVVQSKSCASCSGYPSDYNKVVLKASALQIVAGQTVTITASVPRDSNNEGVTWVFTPGAGAPNPSGTFTDVSTTESTYTAPTAVAPQFTVTIQATSIAFPTEVNSVTITIVPPQALKITTTSLPNGVLGVPYAAGAQMQATGGVPPYTWSLTGMTALPNGLTLNPNGTITGTPIGPNVGIDNNFTIQVADSETPPMTATTTAGQLTITITNLLSGNYAFYLSGYNASGAVVVAGSFMADGLGNITNGVEDFNSIVSNSYKSLTFTGTYTITADNRGQLIFSSLSGTPTYDFSLESTGLHGRVIEFDSTGIRGSGQLEQQNTPTCAANTLSGTAGTSYVMAISGTTANFNGITPGPLAMVGRFTAEVPAGQGTPGSIDTGEVDIQVPGQAPITSDTTLSGTFQTSAQAARCTMSLTLTISTMNFSVYPISSTGGMVQLAFIVETDPVLSTSPYLTVGKLFQQVGYPFTTPSTSLSSGPSAGGIAGSAIPTGENSYLPYVAVAQLNPSGGGGFTMPLFINLGGGVSSYTGATIASTLNPGDSFGRVDTQLLSPISPVFYVINENESYCILENLNAPVTGLFEPQSTGTAASFSAGLVAGTQIAGTTAPNTSATIDFSGYDTLASTGTTTGTVTGVQDTSASGGNVSDQTVTGTFALSGTGQTDGTGTLTLSAPAAFTGDFIIVNPGRIVMISTTAADVNPVLVILGN